MTDFKIQAHIVTRDTITLIKMNGQPFQIPSSSSMYGTAKEALANKDMALLKDIVSKSDRLADKYKAYGRVDVFNGHITVDGTTVTSYLVDRILEGVQEAAAIDPLIAFLDNVMDNPSYRAVQDLYPFLEASELPITEDGYFLAYKGVRYDFRDHHSGTFDNTPGKIVQMARNNVDEDPSRTCSSGLHACGAKYLAGGHYGFGSEKIILVKINPAHVVAFPTDYENQKLRCSQYEVLMEVDRDSFTNFFADKVEINGINLY